MSDPQAPPSWVPPTTTDPAPADTPAADVVPASSSADVVKPSTSSGTDDFPGLPPTPLPEAPTPKPSERIEPHYDVGARVWHRWTDELGQEQSQFGSVVVVNADSQPPTMGIAWWNGGHAVLSQDDVESA